ncbi:hypothetical protein P154DRAFT_620304 [Amniculicola lignicola CBS 123094]|uniref:Uncharacterized protein n=1 Tax=Amniculicola lignicola CBS 123094 TaxID=1392246 RepID=A0A6A5WGH3_9PLEO|nr:hypothetical protein P154DRAFT_620304 [Amniculicola lignicola CBS 123094]
MRPLLYPLFLSFFPESLAQTFQYPGDAAQTQWPTVTVSYGSSSTPKESGNYFFAMMHINGVPLKITVPMSQTLQFCKDGQAHGEKDAEYINVKLAINDKPTVIPIPVHVVSETCNDIRELLTTSNSIGLSTGVGISTSTTPISGPSTTVEDTILVTSTLRIPSISTPSIPDYSASIPSGFNQSGILPIPTSSSSSTTASFHSNLVPTSPTTSSGSSFGSTALLLSLSTSTTSPFDSNLGTISPTTSSGASSIVGPSTTLLPIGPPSEYASSQSASSPEASLFPSTSAVAPSGDGGTFSLLTSTPTILPSPTVPEISLPTSSPELPVSISTPTGPSSSRVSTPGDPSSYSSSSSSLQSFSSPSPGPSLTSSSSIGIGTVSSSSPSSSSVPTPGSSSSPYHSSTSSPQDQPLTSTSLSEIVPIQPPASNPAILSSPSSVLTEGRPPRYSKWTGQPTPSPLPASSPTSTSLPEIVSIGPSTSTSGTPPPSWSIISTPENSQSPSTSPTSPGIVPTGLSMSAPGTPPDSSPSSLPASTPPLSTTTSTVSLSTISPELPPPTPPYSSPIGPPSSSTPAPTTSSTPLPIFELPPTSTPSLVVSTSENSLLPQPPPPTTTPVASSSPPTTPPLAPAPSTPSLPSPSPSRLESTTLPTTTTESPLPIAPPATPSPSSINSPAPTPPTTYLTPGPDWETVPGEPQQTVGVPISSGVIVALENVGRRSDGYVATTFTDAKAMRESGRVGGESTAARRDTGQTGGEEIGDRVRVRRAWEWGSVIPMEKRKSKGKKKGNGDCDSCSPSQAVGGARAFGGFRFKSAFEGVKLRRSWEWGMEKMKSVVSLVKRRGGSGGHGTAVHASAGSGYGESNAASQATRWVRAFGGYTFPNFLNPSRRSNTGNRMRRGDTGPPSNRNCTHHTGCSTSQAAGGARTLDCGGFQCLRKPSSNVSRQSKTLHNVKRDRPQLTHPHSHPHAPPKSDCPEGKWITAPNNTWTCIPCDAQDCVRSQGSGRPQVLGGLFKRRWTWPSSESERRLQVGVVGRDKYSSSPVAGRDGEVGKEPEEILPPVKPFESASSSTDTGTSNSLAKSVSPSASPSPSRLPVFSSPLFPPFPINSITSPITSPIAGPIASPIATPTTTTTPITDPTLGLWDPNCPQTSTTITPGRNGQPAITATITFSLGCWIHSTSTTHPTSSERVSHTNTHHTPTITRKDSTAAPTQIDHTSDADEIHAFPWWETGIGFGITALFFIVNGIEHFLDEWVDRILRGIVAWLVRWGVLTLH